MREDVFAARDVPPASSTVIGRVGMDLGHEIVFVLGQDRLLAALAGDRQSQEGISPKSRLAVVPLGGILEVWTS